MRLIAELRSAAENDNGRAPADIEREARAGVLHTSACNDGARSASEAVQTLMVFLSDGEGSEGRLDDAVGGGLALLPILRAANDDVAPIEADVLLAADREFDARCDEKRDHWIESLEAAGADLAASELDGEGTFAVPCVEGADDHERA